MKRKTMNKMLFLILMCSFSYSVFSQQGFQFEKDDNKISVPFKLINNLVFVPMKVNGIELNFLLDTGVAETILFSLEDKKEVRYFNTERILLKGLGSQAAVEGLKSTNPIFAGVVFELNWGVGAFAVAKCGGRPKFIMF